MVLPMSQQITEDLQRQIETRALSPGDQLPSELQLMERYDASRKAVRDAIDSLISLGRVETRPGQGIFVVRIIDQFVTTLSPDPTLGVGGGEEIAFLSAVRAQNRIPICSVPMVEIQSPPQEIARRLRISAGIQAISRHQKFFIDDTPWSLQTSFYPMDFVIEGASRLLMAEDIEQGALSYLEQAIGVKWTGYHDWITVRMPDNDERRFFILPRSTPVFEIFRTTFSQDGSPLRVTVTVCPGDRNQFLANFGSIPVP